MKRERYSVEQIVAIMKQAEVGIPVAVLISQAGISEQAFLKRIVDERWIRRCCRMCWKKSPRGDVRVWLTCRKVIRYLHQR